MEAKPFHIDTSPLEGVPTVEFVLRGLIISIRHEKLSRQQAILNFQKWFPEADPVPLYEASETLPPRS